MTSPGGYSAGTIFLQVVPSFRGFQEAIARHAKAANKAFGDEMEKGAEAAGERVGDKVGKGASRSMGHSATKLVKQIDEAVAALPDIKLTADSSDVEHHIAQIRAHMLTLRNMDFTVKGNFEKAEHDIKRMIEELREVALGEHKANLDVDAAHAHAALKKLDLELDRFGMKKVTAKADVDTDKGSAGLRGLLNDFDNTGSAMRGFNGMLLSAVAIGPALVPVLAAIGAGLVAIGPAALAGAAGIGVMVLAFSGIQNAVKALNDFDKNVGKERLANMKTMRTAAKGVRDAQQGLDRAREQSARSAEDSARRVQDALRTQSRAERDLVDAQKAEKDAQDDLTKAREEAKQKVEDLSNSIAGGALAERQAVIDLFEATVSYRNAMADPGATNLEKEQASVNLGNARLALKQIRENNVELKKAQAEQNKVGIEGSDGVVQAHDKVKNAHQGVRDAQERVADAARGVQDAHREQARAAVDSQLAIRDATERLSDAQAAYNEALVKTKVVGTASYQKLQDAMGMLGPAGQSFARFLYGLKGQFIELKSVAQEGFLPGLQKGMQTLIDTYGPGLIKFVGDIAKVLGDMAERAGKALTNPMWQRFFDMMATYGPRFLEMWGTIGGDLMTIFANLMVAFAPLGEKMMQGMVDLLDAAVKWSDGLGQSKGFRDFIAYVEKVSPDVLAFFGNLVGALVNLGRALAPYAAALLKILSGFLGWIANMDPKTLAAIAVGILAVVIAIQTLLGVAALIGTIGTAVGIVAELGAVTVGTAGMIVGAVALAIGIFIALAAIFVILYMRSETFRDIVNGAFHAVAAVVVWIWDKIFKPYFELIIGIVKRLWQFWSSVAIILIGIFKWLGSEIGKKISDWTKPGGWLHWMVTLWNGIIAPAWRAGVSVISSIWDSLSEMAKTPIRFMIETVLNKGLIGGFNWLAEKFGAKGIDPIPVPDALKAAVKPQKQDAKGNRAASAASGNGVGGLALATGGIVPGFSPTPTADNIPAWLTAGEFVLPVNAVRNLRSRLGDDFLEQLRQGNAPGYAIGGGVFKGAWNKAKGIGGGIAGGTEWLGDKVKDVGGALLSPLDWLLKRVINRAGDLADSPIGQILTAVPKKLAHMAADALKGMVGLNGGAAPGGGNMNVPRGSAGANAAIVRSIASQYGWDQGDMWSSLVALINSESGFNNTAQNPTSTAYGMFQFLDSTWGIKGVGKTSDPAQQAIAGLEYIRGRYGNPTNAWAFHKANNWYAEGGEVEVPRYAEGGPVLYDDGGYLPPGLTTVLNASGRPEPVLTAQQWDKIEQGTTGGGQGDTFPMTILDGPSPNEIAEQILFRKRHSERGGVYERSR